MVKVMPVGSHVLNVGLPAGEIQPVRRSLATHQDERDCEPRQSLSRLLVRTNFS
jgi:hypothetical protein